jgi:hypothetical protein
MDFAELNRVLLFQPLQKRLTVFLHSWRAFSLQRQVSETFLQRASVDLVFRQPEVLTSGDTTANNLSAAQLCLTWYAWDKARLVPTKHDF